LAPGFYASKDVTLGSIRLRQFKTNYAVSTWIGQNIGYRWGGELRYNYQPGDMLLKQTPPRRRSGPRRIPLTTTSCTYTKFPKKRFARLSPGAE